MDTVQEVVVIQEMVYLSGATAFGRRYLERSVDLSLDNVPDEINDPYPDVDVQECQVHLNIKVEYSDRPEPFPYYFELRINKIDLAFRMKGDVDDEDATFRYDEFFDITIKPPFAEQRIPLRSSGFVSGTGIINDLTRFNYMIIEADMKGSLDPDNWDYEIYVTDERD